MLLPCFIPSSRADCPEVRSEIGTVNPAVEPPSRERHFCRGHLERRSNSVSAALGLPSAELKIDRNCVKATLAQVISNNKDVSRPLLLLHGVKSPAAEFSRNLLDPSRTARQSRPRRVGPGG